MKYVRQFWVILLLSAMGEALHVLIPLPVPASVYGLVIMLIALGTHIIKLEQVKEASEFLIEIMPVMFIPAGVGLLTAWGILNHSDHSDHYSCGNGCDRSCHTGSYS